MTPIMLLSAITGQARERQGPRPVALDHRLLSAKK
jgi:hypothetical protein